MTALDALRVSLAAVNARFVVGSFGEPKVMGRIADHLERTFGEGRAPDEELVVKILRDFIRTGTLAGYRDIKNACYGMLVPVHGNRSVASSLDSTKLLLSIVEQYRSDPKKLKRCFQGLLSAYFSIDGCDSNSEAHPQWLALKGRLADWLSKLQGIKPRPDWLDAALAHRNLFGNELTDRYGAAVLCGDRVEFEGVCDRLRVEPHSWVRRRVVISAIEVAAKKGDAGFRAHLDSLIELIEANPGIRTEGVTKLLNRYAQQVSTSEHFLLRTYAVGTFGNPLITANRSRWFQVSQEGREMVANWLKGFLIERFFELLSHDGRTDKRRPKFWLRHRGSIDTMWFILGSSAMKNRNDDFKKLRETMGNQCLSLQGATAGNNAFVMKIGKIYVVEFGEKGNATFLFDQGALPFELASKYLDLPELKSTRNRLLHKDGHDAWEDKFADALARYGVYPDNPLPRQRATRPTTAPPTLSGVSTRNNFRQVFKQFCNERGLPYDDRAKRGHIVVYVDSGNSVVSGKLREWGFTYYPGSQRWVKNS